MGVIQTPCPHCGAGNVGMQIFGLPHLKPELANNPAIRCEFLVAAACPLCEKPVCAHLFFKQHPGNGPSVTQKIGIFQSTPRTPESLDLQVAATWPKVSGPMIPADIPESSERAYLQAERNYLQNGNEDAAAIMYRKSLEVALKTKYPDAKGPLAKKIDDLAKQGVLPADLSTWSHEIRIIGNDGAHDVDGVTKEELQAIRGFTDAVLRYLFTLPAQVAAKQVTG